MIIPAILACLAIAGHPSAPQVDRTNVLNSVQTRDAWSIIGAEADRRVGFVRLDVKSKPANYWLSSISTPAPSIPKGNEVILRVVAKSPTKSKLTANWEQNSEPYTKYIAETVQLTNEFRFYDFKMTRNEDTPAGKSQISIQVGHDVGTIDIKNIELLVPSSIVSKSSGGSMIANGDFSKGLEGWGGEGSNPPQVTLVDANAPGHKKAAKVSFKLTEANNPWDTQFGQKCNVAVKAGDVVYVRAWLRSPTGSNVMAVYEQAAAPNDKTIFEIFTPSEEWKEYMFAAPAKQSYGPGESQFKFFFTNKSGSVEVAGVRVENMGTAKQAAEYPSFVGTAKYVRDVATIKKAEEQILKIRRGPLAVSVLDSKGKPVAGATVKIKQTRHEFKFGTAVAAFRINEQTPDGDKYRETIKKVFNTVVFENDLKWYIKSDSDWNNVIMPAFKWLESNNIKVRGHNLVWGANRWLPDFIHNLPADQVRPEITKHIDDYANRVKGRVYVWDVVNEAVTERELWDKIGWDQLYNAYRQTRKIDPNAKLCYNDYNICSVAGPSKHRNDAIDIANKIKASGAPVDIFGDQAHMGFPGTSPARLTEIWDEVSAKTGLPIEITEFDFNTRDDAYHGEYTKDFFTMAFAHPKVEALMMWGFWEGQHWIPAAASIRPDWTWRPAMKEIDTLVNKTWRTNTTVKTDATGQVTLPAFYGDYEIEVDVKGAKATIKAPHVKGNTLKATVKVKA